MKGVAAITAKPINSTALVTTSSLSDSIALVANGVLSDSTTSFLASSISSSSSLTVASLFSSFSSVFDVASFIWGMALEAWDASTYQVWILDTGTSYYITADSFCLINPILYCVGIEVSGIQVLYLQYKGNVYL